MPLWHSVPRRLTERCRTRLTASPPQLFFAKVAPSAPANEVARVFEPFGGVEEINLFRAWPTARSSKGCGLVTMTSHEGARAARAALNGRRAWEGADAPMAVEWCAPGKLGVRSAAGKAAGGGRRAPRQSASFSGPAGAGRHRVPQHSASFTGPVGGGRAVGPTSPAAAPAAESTVAAARQFQLQALAAANAGQMQPQLWLEATAMAPAVAPAAPLPGSLRPPSAGCHTLRPLPAPPAPAHLLLAQLGGNAGAGPPAGVAAGRRGLWDAAALPAFTMREPAGSLTGSSALLDPGTFPGTPAGCGAAAGAASLGGRLSDFLIAASVEHAVNSRAAALTAAVAASQVSAGPADGLALRGCRGNVISAISQALPTPDVLVGSRFGILPHRGPYTAWHTALRAHARTDARTCVRAHARTHALTHARMPPFAPPMILPESCAQTAQCPPI
jgi:hypothetical protein